MANKCLAKPSRSLLQLEILGVYMRRINILLQLSDSKHFNFDWTTKHFISEWYFTKNHEIGGLVMRKVKKSWDSQQNRELKLVQLLIFSSCLSPGRVKKLQKFINLCLKVGHVLIWTIEIAHEDNRPLNSVKCTKSAQVCTSLSFYLTMSFIYFRKSSFVWTNNYYH